MEQSHQKYALGFNGDERNTFRVLMDQILEFLTSEYCAVSCCLCWWKNLTVELKLYIWLMCEGKQHISFDWYFIFLASGHKLPCCLGFLLLFHMVFLPHRWMAGHLPGATLAFHPDSVRSGSQSANTASLLDAPRPGPDDSPHPSHASSVHKILSSFPIHCTTV